ncbi:MAG: HDOD domain-containing protein [Fimbriimonadales bacterium]|nr:HDOD domain-containing protein [Fimbriimonadales bacterium]MDW8051499.1 HDOD domain-containing protein [Armatimonadota bacterium]
MPTTLTRVYHSAEELIARTQDLPSLPAVVMRVYQMVEDPSVHAQQVAQEISKDQGFTARVLRVANSAYYGMTRQVATIEEAVIVLGMNTVKNLALIAATYPLFQRALIGYTPHVSSMWTHSLAVGLICQMGARQFDTRVRNEAFTAGLLHDIGKLVISTALTNWMGELYDMVHRKGKPVHEAERELFGFTHEEVGALLIERWKLPPSIAHMIRYHHQSGEVEDPACALVEFADYCANRLGYQMNPEAPQEPFDTRVLNRLNMTLEECELFVQRADEMLTASQSLFRLK